MTESMSTGGTPTSGYKGEDFVCRTCGCEVMVKHLGEPTSHANGGPFICHCGAEMEPEHPGQGGQMRPGDGKRGDTFDQGDFLGQGGGAPEATGMDRAPSGDSGPGGGL